MLLQRAPPQTANNGTAGQTKSGAKSCGPCTGNGDSRIASTAGELTTRPRKARRRSPKARPRSGPGPRDASLSTLPTATALARSFYAPGPRSSTMPSSPASHCTVSILIRAPSPSRAPRRCLSYRIDEAYGRRHEYFFISSWIQIMSSFAHGYGGRVSGGMPAITVWD